LIGVQDKRVTLTCPDLNFVNNKWFGVCAVSLDNGEIMAVDGEGKVGIAIVLISLWVNSSEGIPYQAMLIRRKLRLRSVKLNCGMHVDEPVAFALHNVDHSECACSSIVISSFTIDQNAVGEGRQLIHRQRRFGRRMIPKLRLASTRLSKFSKLPISQCENSILCTGIQYQLVYFYV
jgi:hypothetical protein